MSYLPEPHQPPHRPPAAQQLTCRICGATPAVKVTVHEHHGMIILMQMLTLKGPLCREHGMAAVKRMTGRSLLLGWWGLISLFVMNPITLFLNLIAWLKIRGLAAPTQAAPGYAPAENYGPPPQAYAPPPYGYAPPQPQGYAPPSPGGHHQQPGYALPPHTPPAPPGWVPAPAAQPVPHQYQPPTGPAT